MGGRITVESVVRCLWNGWPDDRGIRNYPAEHWVHIRTTNPIESTFATVRLRSKRSRNCGSRATTLAMVFKLLQSAQKRWKRIKGFNKLELVVNNVQFKDGEPLTDQSDRTAA